jgi:hypothetical protein
LSRSPILWEISLSTISRALKLVRKRSTALCDRYGGEIPTFQELQGITGNSEGLPSKAELDAYAARVTARYADGLILVVDGANLPLRVLTTHASLLTGAGGLQTMRIECDLVGAIPSNSSTTVRRLRFEDRNYPDRIGWRELVVSPLAGTSVFNSSAYGAVLLMS